MKRTFVFLVLILAMAKETTGKGFCGTRMVDGKLQKFGDCDDKQQSQVLEDLGDKLEKDNQNLSIDVLFVVDGSASVGRNNFNIVRKWLVNATKALIEKYGNAIRTEVLQYSNKELTGASVQDTNVFEIPYTLNDHLTLDEMERRILNMKYLESQTYTYYALRRVMEVEFPSSNYYNESNKIVVVLTDGAATDPTFLQDWYDRYKNSVTPIVIGLKATKGSQFYSELQKVANGGGSDERVLTTADFNSTVTNKLVSLIETAVKLGSG